MTSRTIPDLLFIGPLPPPVHGQAAATKDILDMLVSRGLRVEAIDTGEGRMSGAARSRRASIQLRAIRTILRSPAPHLYLSVNANRGMALTVLLCLAGRISGKTLTLHHHAYHYIAEHHAIMSLLGKAAGPQALHLAPCLGIGADLRDRYSSVRHILGYSNVGVVDNVLRPSARADEQPVRLGHMSNLTKAKGIGTTIAAFRAIRAAGREVTLVVAGPCSDSFASEAIASAEREFGEAFTYLGPVYGEAKQRFFDSFDIFVFPSEMETQGIVNLEAMSCGKPVVATGHCCIPRDIGRDGGLAVDPMADFAQALLGFIGDYLQDPAGASARARLRYEALLAEHEGECEALVAGFRGDGAMNTDGRGAG